ncbi:MAG TPA: UDP-N-acetylglucosamine 1-carboxyvinyltransferase, partial [Candidatus Staskawiczbacteria bacterium]|nr:UDP-N-acetylglucosamine 1-carboxyvinyltransferase [Candidatus Staskawiczbacteria bacterium]
MSEKFIINGGKKLEGEIEVMGSKNTALPVLAATLLTTEPCEIDNLPLIEDIFKLLQVLEKMGAKVEWLSERKIRIQCKDVNIKKIPNELLGHFRGAVLLWG